MILLSLLCWGPIPLACLWLGSQADYLSGSVSFGILVSFIGLFGLLFGALALLRRLDNAWILVRRAAGHDQRTACWGAIFGDHRRGLRRRLHVLVRRHPRPRLERRLRQRRRREAARTRSTAPFDPIPLDRC